MSTGGAQALGETHRRARYARVAGSRSLPGEMRPAAARVLTLGAHIQAGTEHNIPETTPALPLLATTCKSGTM